MRQKGGHGHGLGRLRLKGQRWNPSQQALLLLSQQPQRLHQQSLPPLPLLLMLLLRPRSQPPRLLQGMEVAGQGWVCVMTRRMAGAGRAKWIGERRRVIGLQQAPRVSLWTAGSGRWMHLLDMGRWEARRRWQRRCTLPLRAPERLRQRLETQSREVKGTEVGVVVWGWRKWCLR